MAFLMSPGVLTTETDLTNVVPALATSIGATVGVFQWGPVLDVTTVDYQGTLLKWFGKPNDDTATSFYTAANFLDYTNQLKIVRVVGGNAKNATSDGKGILIKNRTVYDNVFADGNAAVGAFTAKYPSEMANGLEIAMADAKTFPNWEYRSNFTNPPNVNESDNDEMHMIIIDRAGKFSGTKGTILEKYPFLSKAVDSKSSDGPSNYYKTVISRSSEYIYWTDHPTGMYNPSVTFVTGSNRIHLSDSSIETYRIEAAGNVLRLDLHGLQNGDTIVFDQINRTQTISTGVTYYVINATPATFAISLTPNGSAVDADLNGYALVRTLKPHPYSDGQKISFKNVSGVTTVQENTNYYIINVTELDFQISDTLGGTPLVFDVAGLGTLVSVAGAAWGSPKDGTVFKDLTDPISIILDGGVDDNNILDESAVLEGWQMFQDPEKEDINLLIGGAVTSYVSKYIIQNVAETRKDCIAFVSTPAELCINNPYAIDDILDWRADQRFNVDSSYGALDSGWKYQYDQYNETFRWVPLCADTAGLHARTDDTNDPWWAAAGLNRGKIKNVVKLAWNPTKTDRDRLYQAGINPVVSLSGQGVVLFGNKTLLAKPSAFDRINVRRLMIVIERAIARSAKYFLFEFINDQFTRAQFINMITPYLRTIQGRRGIAAFQIVCDETNNTQQIISTNQLVADIKVMPNYVAEFITLNFIAVNNSAMFTES